MGKDANYTTALKNLDLLYENGGAEISEILQRKILLAMKNEVFTDAIKFASQDITSSPKKEILYLRGFAHAKINNLTEALADFEKVKTLDGNYKKNNDYITSIKKQMEKKDEDDEVEDAPAQDTSQQEEASQEDTTANSNDQSDDDWGSDEDDSSAQGGSSQSASSDRDDEEDITVKKEKPKEKPAPKKETAKEKSDRIRKKSGTSSASERIKKRMKKSKEMKSLEAAKNYKSTNQAINLQNADGSGKGNSGVDPFGEVDEEGNSEDVVSSFVKFMAIIVGVGIVLYFLLFVDGGV